MNESPLMELKGTNGTVVVYEDRVVIKRKGAFSYLSQGVKGESIFFYQDLSSVDFKKPSLAANGYIHFVTPGSVAINAGSTLIGTTPNDLLHDPNTVVLRAFRRSVPALSQQLYDLVLEKIRDAKNSEASSTGSFSAADEIVKFKNLLDQGIITEEEFEEKKQQLLAL